MKLLGREYIQRSSSLFIFRELEIVLDIFLKFILLYQVCHKVNKLHNVLLGEIVQASLTCLYQLLNRSTCVEIVIRIIDGVFLSSLWSQSIVSSLLIIDIYN